MTVWKEAGLICLICMMHTSKVRKKISQINAEFQASYVKSEESMERPEEEYSSTSGEIMKLKQMLDDGILTEDEFAAAKKRVLGL